MDYKDISILKNVKESLGINSEDKSFDTEICVYINGAIGILSDIGEIPYVTVMDETVTYSSLEPVNNLGNAAFNFIPQFLFVSVKQLFDPPNSGAAQATLERIKTDLIWRLNIAYDEGYVIKQQVGETDENL